MLLRCCFCVLEGREAICDGVGPGTKQLNGDQQTACASGDKMLDLVEPKYCWRVVHTRPWFRWELHEHMPHLPVRTLDVLHSGHPGFTGLSSHVVCCIM